MLWHCWLGDRKGIRPVKSWVLVCWWWRFDWSFAYFTAPVVITTSIIFSSNKSRMETSWYLLTYVHFEKWLLKWRERENFVLNHTSLLSHACYDFISTLKMSLSLRFNGHFPGEPGLAGVYWSKGWWKRWWQLEVMEVQSNHHHQQTNTQFFTGRMPFLLPNQQCQSTEQKSTLKNVSWK